ncbi:uncharacterized protein LOC135154648 [Lytechinus pictus]|uniref:uncharacterized protein LOC135154648 n=1 Tax=Lytechinus pictus TaxID=7653 RepID=UPI0030B9ECE9
MKVTDSWGWIEGELGHNPPRNRLCEMYHTSMDKNSQARITRAFLGQETNFAVSSQLKGNQLCCVIATVAFGLGIDLSDVDIIFHSGVPCDVMTYWQDVPGMFINLNQIKHVPGKGNPADPLVHLPMVNAPRRECDIAEDYIDIHGSSSNDTEQN